MAQRTNQYDDNPQSYRTYWVSRGYEHDAEVAALRRLLEGRHFGHAADVGGYAGVERQPHHGEPPVGRGRVGCPEHAREPRSARARGAGAAPG